MLKQCTYKLVGSFRKYNKIRLLIFISLIFFSFAGVAAGIKDESLSLKNTQLRSPDAEWADIEKDFLKSLSSDRTNGISYMVSGSFALAGGIAGTGVTSDPLEKGIYSLFQTIGIASLGYGAYKWQIGDDRRLLILSLKLNPDLSPKQKLSLLKSYVDQKKNRELKEHKIRAVTHALIAALNFYNSSQQTNESVKNTLNFIGGANILASLSYTF